MRREAYGPAPEQFGHLYPGSRPATVVVVHGGFWRPHRTLEMTAPLAEEAAGRGWSVWNVEYRRAGQGSWRDTLDDCAAAVAHLGDPPGGVLIVGHSAGGQLAVRTAADTGARGVVSIAGVLDLVRAARAGTGDAAVAQFLGGSPEDVPERYRAADPLARLPLGAPVRCVHGRADERVPFEQSARYVEAAARAGDDARLVEVGGVHTDGIDPRTPAGRRVVVVEELGGGP